MRTINSKTEGFTLLELVIVLAGLGILSSLAIPNFIKYLDYAKVDEAKSLLNSVAADCLQKLRKDDNALGKEVDPLVISTDRLKNTGYSFNVNENPTTQVDYLPKCGSVFITAMQPKDRDERYPDLGFIIDNTPENKGKLTKIAVNTGSDTEFAAKSWAGSKTTDSGALKKWQELNTAILNAQQSCKQSRLNFAKTIGNGPTKMWDPVASSGCTSSPPIDEGNLDKCTPGGCTKDIWYLDGDICGTNQMDYQKCLDVKLGEVCAQRVDQHRKDQTTSSISTPTIITECEEPEFWFCNGSNKGSQSKLEECLRDQQEKNCITEQEKARESGHTGKFGPLPGPGKCADVKYICNKTFVSEQDYFINCKTSEKAAPTQCSDTLNSVDQECWNYEKTQTLIDKCGHRPLKNNGADKDCGAVGQGKPTNEKGWEKFPECSRWANCMGF